MLAGPDVSNYQRAIAWPRVRLAGHELAFAIAKATDGTGYVDPYFAGNWRGIRERGLIRGAYHFARPGATAAAAEAEHFVAVLQSVGGIGEGDLPPILDLETSYGLASAQLYEWTDTWVHMVESRVGRKPIIYTGWLWKSYLDMYTNSWGCPLWLAEYGPTPHVPRAWRTWTLWQFTDAARLDGISGGVDLSYFNGSHAELEHLGAMSTRARPAAVSSERRAHPDGPSAPAHVLGGLPRWPGRTLKRGDHGADVREWQERMRQRGFVDIRTDGVFDDCCAERCRWLQEYLSLSPTAEVDEALWQATWLAP